MTRRMGLVLILALLAAPAVAGAPADPAVAFSRAPDLYLDWLHSWPAATGTVGASALRIGIDPETGSWGYVPVPPGGLRLSAAPTEIRTQRADGTVEVIVRPMSIEYVIARIGAAGRRSFECVAGDDGSPGAVEPAAYPPIK